MCAVRDAQSLARTKYDPPLNAFGIACLAWSASALFIFIAGAKAKIDGPKYTLIVCLLALIPALFTFLALL